MMVPINNLLDLRSQINKIDQNIVKLLASRKILVCQIAKLKMHNNQSIRDVSREKNILHVLSDLGKENGLSSEYINQIFQIIIQESILTQKQVLKKSSKNSKANVTNISFLGLEGSFSHIVASEYAKRYCKKYIFQHYKTFKKVILSVEKNQSDYAILPLENNNSGCIKEVLELLETTSLYIVAEIKIPIQHCLLTLKNTQLHQIKNIYSHKQPFLQCSQFIKEFPHWNIKYTFSTSHAMQEVCSLQNQSNAALGSEQGGQIYGLNVLLKNLSDTKNNTTRFIVLHKNSLNASHDVPTKKILLIKLTKTSKDLFEIISILEKNKIKFKKFISRNILYIDIKQHLPCLCVEELLKKIHKITTHAKILGCYTHDNIIFLKK